MLSLIGQEGSQDLEHILRRNQHDVEVWISSTKHNAEADAIAIGELDVEEGDVNLTGMNEQPCVGRTRCRHNDIDVGHVVESRLQEVAIELVVFNYGNTNGGIVHSNNLTEVVSVLTPSPTGIPFLTQWAQT